MRTSRRLRFEATSELATPAQYTVLAWLDNGTATVSQLAEAEHVRTPSMTRTINGMERAGLVRRSQHPEDGRQVLVGLTDAGRAVLRDTRRRRTEWLERHLARLAPQQRETLREAAEILLSLSESERN